MKHRTKKILSYIITLAVIIVAGLWVASKFIHFGNVEFTDNAQVHIRIINDYNSVTFFHRLIFIETDFLDVALHSAVDRHNLTLHLRIVGKLHIAEMDEQSLTAA